MSIERLEVERAVMEARKWLQSPNIVYVGVGSDGPDDYHIEVRVIRKKKLHEMDESDIFIPPKVEHHVQDDQGAVSVIQVRTRVVESGALRLAPLDQHVRPTPGGYKISVVPSWLGDEAVGTLGANLSWAGKFRLLTNNHVISKNGGIGNTVYQPEQGIYGNTLTTVSGYMPVTTTPNRHNPNPVYNNYDFAYCDVTALQGATNIASIGVPAGYRAPVNGEGVRWIGQVTAAVQAANIAGLAGQAVLEFTPGQWAFFQNVMTFNAGIVVQGDSGSAIVATADMNVVGLVFANDANNNGYALRIPPY